MAAFDVSFIYRLIDRYTPQMKRIASTTKRFSGKLGRVAGGIDKFGDKLRNAGSFAGAAASGFAALAISMPVRKAMAFEDAVTNLDKAFNFKSAGQRRDFIADIKAMAPGLGLTGSAMAGLAFEAGKLGIPLQEVTKFTQLAAKASVAFDGLPIEEAGQIIGDLKNKFGLATDGVENLLDSVNTLADNTTANGGQILNVVSRMSGLFSALEFPPELAAGLSTFARQVSVSDELAASGLKQFTQKLIETGHQADLMKDPLGTIQGVIDKIRAVPQGKRGGAIIDAFGLEAAPFVTALVSKSELLAKTMSNVADKTRFAGSMQSEFNRQAKNTSFRAQQIRAKFGVLLETLGTQLLPMFNKLIDQTGPLLDRFTKFVEKHPGLVKIAAAVGAIVAAMIPLAIVIGTILLVLNPVTLIITGIVAAFTAASAAVWLWFDDVKSVVQSVTSIFDPFFTWLEGKFDVVGGFLSGAANFLGLGGGEQTREIAANSQSSQAATLNGKIDVGVTGPGQVTGARIKSDAPGNLGFNAALAGG